MSSSSSRSHMIFQFYMCNIRVLYLNSEYYLNEKKVKLIIQNGFRILKVRIKISRNSFQCCQLQLLGSKNNHIWRYFSPFFGRIPTSVWIGESSDHVIVDILDQVLLCTQIEVHFLINCPWFCSEKAQESWFGSGYKPQS